MNLLQALWRPYDSLRLTTLARRRAELPEDARTKSQAIGTFTSGCGATHGVHERCNFGCTACYLADNANAQPPLPFAAVAAQLHKLATYLGPGGNVQITSGEVTLLPREDLAKILKTAYDYQLSPMLMTHGDVLLHEPDYLEHLIRKGGLRKLSIHVDMLQRGRKGYGKPESEAQLNTVRTAFAERLRLAKRATGRRLKASMTLTVNRHNIDQLDTVVDWLNDNLDTFRMLSLQPQAKTGRTRDDDGVDADAVWARLEHAFGRKLNPRAIHFGHPSCNRIALLLQVKTHRGEQVIEAISADHPEDREFIDNLYHDFAGVSFNDVSTLKGALLILGVLCRKPWWLPRLSIYGVKRLWRERSTVRQAVTALIRGKLRVRAFALVVHAFMDRNQLQTPEGQERLKTCAFKLPIGDRMVSMCEMNGTDLRAAGYSI